MNEKWTFLSPKVRGSSLIGGNTVHILHEDQTQTWCGLPKEGMETGFLDDGSTVNCSGCIDAVVAKFYPMFEKRQSADVSPYIGKIVQLEQEEESGDCCPKCRSERVTRRFGQSDSEGSRYDNANQRYEPTDSEDYKIHHDTYVCLDCRYWDFYSAFDNATHSVQMECPVDRVVTKHHQKDFDNWTGYLELLCNECQCGTTLRLIEKGKFEIVQVRAG
jgi:hypothetical protein